MIEKSRELDRRGMGEREMRAAGLRCRERIALWL